MCLDLVLGLAVSFSNSVRSNQTVGDENIQGAMSRNEASSISSRLILDFSW